MPSLTKRFEFFVAFRYLMAKRKQAVISVITGISVIGVAAGVMALVIALAVNAGFRNTLQRNLLGATAHVMILEKQTSNGIADWRDLVQRLQNLPGVTEASPSLYDTVMFSGPGRPAGGYMKGVPGPESGVVPEPLKKLKAGTFTGWDKVKGTPPIVLGSKLAEQTGMRVGSVVRVLSPQGEPTPWGPRMIDHRFRVVGIFESGYYDLDSSFAFASLEDMQRVMSVGDVVNAVELRLQDIYQAPQIAEAAVKLAGPNRGATTWMEQNSQLLGALHMERVVTVITIGLIQMVGALNILISLIMMVMEKHRDIAILMSMGARKEQIARVFQFQGVLIGAAGTVIGLVAGYTLSYFANRGQWVRLPEAVYSLSFVPFEPRALDGVWISAAALFVSFLATIYPARNAAKIAPAVALRYE
jgi:lipoprotein-releasing system permease protein